MTPLWAHKAESLFVCFFVCPDLQNFKRTPLPTFSIIHAASGASCKYCAEGKPPYYYLCLNIPECGERGNPSHELLRFLHAEPGVGKPPGEPPLSRLFCSCCLSSSYPGLLSLDPSTHLLSPPVSRTCLEGGWYSLRFSCRSSPCLPDSRGESFSNTNAPVSCSYEYNLS